MLNMNSLYLDKTNQKTHTMLKYELFIFGRDKTENTQDVKYELFIFGQDKTENTQEVRIETLLFCTVFSCPNNKRSYSDLFCVFILVAKWHR